MTFQPAVDQVLVIAGVPYRVAEHPAAPGMPYGQQGRQATIYQLAAGGDRRALKVFISRFQVPGLVTLTDRLAPYAALPGLQVCRRTVLTARRHTELLRQYPDLTYAVVMPWVPGPTWQEVLLGGHALAPEQSLALARALAETLAGMEEQSLAHGDLSSPNLLLPALAEPASGAGAPLPGSGSAPIELVDVEQMYGPGLDRPAALTSGSAGYAHGTAAQGLWVAEADRFAGALLLAELLGWCDARVRAAAWGESYFDPDEMQQPGARATLLAAVLGERWGAPVAALFERAWSSETLADCPTFGTWLVTLPERVPVAVTPPPRETAAAHAAPAGTGLDVAGALLDLAQDLERQGNLAGALTTYRRALAAAPAGSGLAQELPSLIHNLEARLAAPSPPPPPPPPPVRPPPPPAVVSRGRGAPWPWIVAPVLLLLLVIGVAGSAVLQRAEPTPTPVPATTTDTPVPAPTDTPVPSPTSSPVPRPATAADQTLIKQAIANTEKIRTFHYRIELTGGSLPPVRIDGDAVPPDDRRYLTSTIGSQQSVELVLGSSAYLRENGRWVAEGGIFSASGLTPPQIKAEQIGSLSDKLLSTLDTHVEEMIDGVPTRHFIASVRLGHDAATDTPVGSSQSPAQAQPSPTPVPDGTIDLWIDPSSGYLRRFTLRVDAALLTGGTWVRLTHDAGLMRTPPAEASPTRIPPGAIPVVFTTTYSRLNDPSIVVPPAGMSSPDTPVPAPTPTAVPPAPTDTAVLPEPTDTVPSVPVRGVVKIAVDLPVGGAEGANGLPTREGVALAIDQANAAGGVMLDGKPYLIQMDFLDDVPPGAQAHDPAQGSKNADAFIADPAVLAMVGPFNSNVARAMMPKLNQAGLANISPSNTAPDLTLAAFNPNLAALRPSGKITYFRVSTTDNRQGPAGADYAYDKLGKKKAYILDDTEAYGKDIADGFEKEWRVRGGTVLNHQGVPSGTTDFSSIMSTVAAVGADLLYYGGTQSNGIPLARKAMKAAGLRIPLMGGDGIVESGYTDKAGADAEGDYGTVPAVNANLLPAAQPFIATYHQAFAGDQWQGVPQAYSANAYDATNIIIAAMKTAHTLDREAIRAAIAATKSYLGAIGATGFDANGDTTNRWISVYQVQNGAWTYLDQLRFFGNP